MSSTSITRSSVPRFYFGWVILALSTLSIFFSAGTRSLYAVFYLAQVQEFGWGRGTGSIAYTVNLLVFLLGVPFLGALLDRWGPRVVFSIATVFIASGLALGVLIHQAWHFIVTFGIITGLGFVATSQPLHGSVLAKWFASRRGLAMGIAASGGGLAQTVMSPIIHQFIGAWGWRLAYLALAGATLFLVPFIAFFFRDDPKSIGEHIDGDRPSNPSTRIVSARRRSGKTMAIQVRNPKWAETNWTLRRAVRTWPFWGIMGVSLFQSYSLHFVMVHSVALLVDSGFSPASASVLYGIIGGGTVVGLFIWGGLSDRTGREVAYSLGTLLFFITIASLGVIRPGMRQIATWSVAFFLGIGIGSRPTLFNLIAVDIFQGKHAGKIMGLGATGFGIGGSFGSLSAGYIFDYTGSYDWAIRICMVTLAISAVCAWVAGPSRIRKPVFQKPAHKENERLFTGFYR